ncbi:MAG TPA: aldo/keto reductase [Acetobacteraceae bacterium]|jgi:aryl-alcohol dehydrogenase-like predicted oxidoreductase|nr:aldo/keto reductase [Acetobacteraceae bacterium]
MEQIEIRGTGMTSSRIALGTWAIGGWMWGGSDAQQSIATIQAAIDRGITMIDTAPVYGFGRSEEIVGQALAHGGRRNRVLIATKVGLNWHNGQVFRDSSPVRIRQEVEDSLRRLRTDTIDLYQVHWPDPTVPIEDTARELERLFRAGKIRAIGVSNYSPDQMEQFRSASPLHANQPPYNAFERQVENDVLPYATRHGITVLAYGALCRGLLTGRMRADTKFDGDDLRLVDPKFQQPRYRQYLEAVDVLGRFARERYGRSVLALAVRWILDRGPTIALWGARRPDQLDPVEEIMGWSIDQAAMREIDAILAQCIIDPVGPQFMAPPALPTRLSAA